jgi:hypothetical protein
VSPFPVIRTALPQRRYRVGEYQVTLLAEVESGDGVDYQYILAFVEEGRSRPSLYLCSERNPPGERGEGSHRLRLVNDAMSEVLGSNDAWRHLDFFAEEAMRIGIATLALRGEQPVRLA